MFGTTELVVVFLIVVLLFGATKLPQLGRSLGSFITEFKEGAKGKTKDEGHKNNEEEKDE